MSRPTLKTISNALLKHYTPPQPGLSICRQETLCSILRSLPSCSEAKHNDSILVQMHRHHASVSLLPEDYVVIAYVDDCIGRTLQGTDLDFEVEAFIRQLAPLVASLALEQKVTSIMKPQRILDLLEKLVNACMGWSEDLGILGQRFVEKIEIVLRDFISGRQNLKQCEQALDRFLLKETVYHQKLESRLCDSEVRILSTQKGQYFAAELLNEYMADQQLPLFIIFMLQGSWYEFLQQIIIHSGPKSKDWQAACALTQLLVWSVQPHSNRRKQLSVMKDLPTEISKFARQLDFNTAAVEQCIADLLTEYQAIKKKKPSPPCDFDLFETDSSIIKGAKSISRLLYKQIKQYEEGQWFLYDDKTESAEKIARLRLILNWRDSARLLFTNQNRRKVLQMPYDEFAERISNGSIKVLNLEQSFVEVNKSHLANVIHKVQIEQDKVTRHKTAEKKLATGQFLARRTKAIRDGLAEERKRAKLKKQRALTLRNKAERKYKDATSAVASLNVDAWVKLPVMQGSLTPCKLVAIIPGSDKYIFTNRAGEQVANFTSSQLSQMIVTENSEILDTGAEFATVLSSIVSGIREARKKPMQ